MSEMIVDSFAGGGGASTGIEMALGRSPDIAINHDAVALAMHAANHPRTRHLPHNIWKVDPTEACAGGTVGLLWASPDCKHFSKAKGGKPVNKNIRDLAWVIVRWAKQVTPRVIILENVEEFEDWGPVLENGSPCKDRKGLHFRRFVRELRALGYKVEHRELRAADYGSPTVRKRLFLIARRDGLPIVWPAPTHGDPKSEAVQTGRLKPWRAAAEIIDWSLVCPSIFESSAEIKKKHGIRAIRPLAPSTMARIARGVKRYVIDAAEPFIVPITHTGDERVHGLRDPLRTVTGAHRGEQAFVTPFLAPRYQEKNGQDPRTRSVKDPAATITSHGNAPGMLLTPFVTKFNKGVTGHAANEPLHTITSCHSDRHPAGSSTFGVVAPVLINTRNGEREGQKPRCRDIGMPYATVTAKGSQGAVVAAFLAQHNTDMVGHHPHEPVSTIVQKGCTQAVVSAGLVNLKGSDRRQSSIEDPNPTQCAGGWHVGEVRAFLMKYYGTDQDPQLEKPLHTATTKDRFSLVTVMVNGEPHVIVDIGMRMLSPRELFCAQGFPADYRIDRDADGNPISKTDQIRMCGNSVCPQVAAALVEANYSEMTVDDRGVPEFAWSAAE